MAEIVGVVASGITIAALFKTCLDAIDLIRTAQHQDLDVKKLTLKLNIEKCRLYTWGEALGLAATAVDGQPCYLDTCPSHIRDLVTDTLDTIISLFMDSGRLKDRYGCKEISSMEASAVMQLNGPSFGPLDKLTISFSHFWVAGRSPQKLARLALKTKWVIADRKKFIELVLEIRTFVDGLHDITQSRYPAVQQENSVRRRIQRINDVETLDLIADVCEVDHPPIADAASERSTIISSAPFQRSDIEQWASDVVPGSGGELIELESLTMTELKHQMLVYADELARADIRSKPKELSTSSSIGAAVSMRIISVVTLLYLPATLVAVLFLGGIISTDFSSSGFFVSPSTYKFWINMAAAIPLGISVLVALLWFRYERRRLLQRKKRDSYLKQS